MLMATKPTLAMSACRAICMKCLGNTRKDKKVAKMFKYAMTATAFKMFSASPQTKQLYRLLGNTVGQKRRIREGLSDLYVERAKMILELCKKYDAIHAGDRLLEIGTGWLHWESTILRLFYDVEITLFDVWDNRQLDAYKHHFRQLEEIIDQEFEINHEQSQRIHKLLQAIAQAGSFEEIYRLFGFQYVINPSGKLNQFPDESFTVIFSSNVLEHVDEDILPEFTQDFYRLLKPGCFSIHQIDLGDHLAYYDRGVSLKNYLRYSDKVWKRYFRNDVQYFNLVQRPQWLGFFQMAGFETVQEESIRVDIGQINVDPSYAYLDDQDLQCRTLRVVQLKPY
jgi:cyclopropane fatty-acyl-phospholipid synthase-like methyltransferase